MIMIEVRFQENYRDFFWIMIKELTWIQMVCYIEWKCVHKAAFCTPEINLQEAEKDETTYIVL